MKIRTMSEKKLYVAFGIYLSDWVALGGILDRDIVELRVGPWVITLWQRIEYTYLGPKPTRNQLKRKRKKGRK